MEDLTVGYFQSIRRTASNRHDSSALLVSIRCLSAIALSITGPFAVAQRRRIHSWLFSQNSR